MVVQACNPSALRRLRPKDHKFEASLGYIASFRSYSETLSQRTEMK
jgi:hypothetical protein